MLSPAGVWDIEAAGWDRFRVGELLASDGARFVSWDEDDFFDALVARSGTWYAHAGGRYDVLWALSVAARRRLPWSARLRGAGVLSVRLGCCELRDSFAIVPMSLAKAAALAGDANVRKMELGLACECGDDCGGYCALGRDLAPRERRAVEEYLHADCVALLALLRALDERAERDGIALKLTVGGTAWATARAWLDLPKATHDLGTYRRLREGYYGGRVEVFRRRAPRGHRYDIHSSYPAALTRVALPFGELVKHRSRAAAGRAYAAGREGVYGADVFMPFNTRIPPLPVRVADRLLYPVGRFSGAWTAIELRHAESCGARVERVRWGYSWREAEVLLRPFAERVWALRDDAARAGESAWAAWYKWLANSLTGKLAQRPEVSSLHFEPGDPPAFEPMGAPIVVVRETADGLFHARHSIRVDACAHVQWSAYLTAEARIELHRQLEHAARPLYCDTDSVYARDALTRRLGDGLGEWGHEGALRGWRALAPKVYRYIDDDGAVRVRGKGMPGLDADGFDALARGRQWRDERGVHGLRTAVRSGDSLFKRRALARGLHPVPGWIGGRELEPNGLDTRPTTLARYARRPKR